MAKNCSTLAS